MRFHREVIGGVLVLVFAGALAIGLRENEEQTRPKPNLMASDGVTPVAAIFQSHGISLDGITRINTYYPASPQVTAKVDLPPPTWWEWCRATFKFHSRSSPPRPVSPPRNLALVTQGGTYRWEANAQVAAPAALILPAGTLIECASPKLPAPNIYLVADDDSSCDCNLFFMPDAARVAEFLELDGGAAWVEQTVRAYHLGSWGCSDSSNGTHRMKLTVDDAAAWIEEVKRRMVTPVVQVYEGTPEPVWWLDLGNPRGPYMEHLSDKYQVRFEAVEKNRVVQIAHWAPD